MLLRAMCYVRGGIHHLIQYRGWIKAWRVQKVRKNCGCFGMEMTQEPLISLIIAWKVGFITTYLQGGDSGIWRTSCGWLLSEPTERNFPARMFGFYFVANANNFEPTCSTYVSRWTRDWTDLVGANREAGFTLGTLWDERLYPPGGSQ